MVGAGQDRSWIFRTSLPAATAAQALAIAFLLAVVATQPAQAQTFNVVHTFTGPDGGYPLAGATLDRAGNLYGTAFLDGGNGYGTVYQLKPKASGWVFNILYSLPGASGANPPARVIFGPNGTLYGTTYRGGAGYYGTVFNLTPFPSFCKTALCPWKETVLHSFGPPDGVTPNLGDLLFDQAGNIYGTTIYGGNQTSGTVYELTPSGSGWTECVLHSFSGNDGAYPNNGVIFDNAGNLYGTTTEGGSGNSGTVFKLTPSGSGCQGWTESILYRFQNGSDGDAPYAGLIFDLSGNLYGATSNAGSGGSGTVFELSPAGNGSWTYSLIYSFTGDANCGPEGSLVMDGAGNLYGTTVCDGADNFGSVFKLTPTPQPPWTYTSLHDFTGVSDGARPYSTVVFDASGNLYGTATSGGEYGDGVVWEITP